MFPGTYDLELSLLLPTFSGRQVQDRGDLQRERVQASAGAAQG